MIPSIAVLTRWARPWERRGAFGALATVQNLGWGTGPIVGSVFAAVAGIPALYVVSAALMLVTVAVVRVSPGWFAYRIVPATATPVAVGADPGD